MQAAVQFNPAVGNDQEFVPFYVKITIILSPELDCFALILIESGFTIGKY